MNGDGMIEKEDGDMDKGLRENVNVNERTVMNECCSDKGNPSNEMAGDDEMYDESNQSLLDVVVRD